MPKPPPAAAPCVGVIARNPETLADLRGYLSEAGVSSAATTQLRDAVKLLAHTKALVIFPDELDTQQVLATLRQARTTHPQQLVVIVTSAPQHLSSALQPDGRSIVPMVLPKPAFSWTILDALRAHLRAVHELS